MLKKAMFLLVGCVLINSSFLYSTNSRVQDAMHFEIDSLYNHFALYYAPLPWKKSHLGVELKVERDRIKEVISNDAFLTLSSYRSLVREFLFATRDYHVAPIFQATEAATLPFTVKEAGRRFFVGWVDKAAGLDLDIGDEIVAWDGVPISQVVEDVIQTETRRAAPQTDLAKATAFLTLRAAKGGARVPQAQVFLQVKKKNRQEVADCSVTWTYYPEQYPSFGFSTKELKPINKIESLLNSSVFNPISIDGDAESIKGLKDKHPLPVGYRNTQLPPLGRVVWHSDASSSFDAYIAVGDMGKRIAFVRVPTYSLSEEKDYHSSTEEFSGLMIFFESESDALVIDQRDNPGGSVFYALGLASTLVSDPLPLPFKQLALDSNIVSDVWEILTNWKPLIEGKEDFNGMPLTDALRVEIKNYYLCILEEWKSGSNTTPALPLYVSHYPQRFSCSYTKPLYILINELSGSSAELFPAILQDNGRATIVGTRTMGAGGSVKSYSSLSLFGLSQVYYTWNLTWRSNGDPIEDLGVMPDVFYPLTVEDLTNNYSPYATFLQKIIERS